MSASNPDPPMPQQPRYKRNYGPESQEDFEAFYRREPTSYHRYIDRHEPRLEDYNDKKRFLWYVHANLIVAEPRMRQTPPTSPLENYFVDLSVEYVFLWY
jgi:hypothetical protein